MNLETLALLGEFVGGVFVVVSLVYLARQIRQNTRFQQTENYARVLERMSTLQARLAADAELNRVVSIGAEDPARLSRGDRIRFTWALYELFGAGEFMYHQAKAGALPPEVWVRWEETITWWLSHPGMRVWWSAKPTPLSRDFESHAQEIMASRTVEESVNPRWRAFVAGDLATAAGTAP